MGWGASLSSRGLGAKLSTSQPQRRSMGDAIHKLDMDTDRAFLPPVFENHSLLATAAPLTVHVEVQFTDPVIKSRYCRSYSSSPTFEPTPRICRGLMRRIERCSEELITRKDSGALDVFKEESSERKSLRYEMTFRIIRRDKGEWAEMTFRSYQKHPLTVELTKDIKLATHRMIGLFLRKHDRDFLWLDVPESDIDHGEPKTTKPDDPLSLSCVPNSRFNETTQTFDFLPGYHIEVSFRSRNPQRKAPLIRKSLRLTSTQAAPLTLSMSEDLLWKGSQAINYELDARKKEFDDQSSRRSQSHHSFDGALEIDLRISNILGPAYAHVHRCIQSRLILFRHPEGKDCDDFLRRIEISLAGFRDNADAKINSLDDLEINICELKGAGWKLRQPLKFSLGSSSSYGRRIIQAALDRIQTGIADVIRGRELAVHLTAHKRGHLVLDKTIIAHEKRGQPKEWFSSSDEEQQTFAARLNTRIQADLNMIFEDSCSIDDLPDEEEDHTRPPTPVLSSRATSVPSEGSSASSFKSPSKLTRSLSNRLQGSPKRFVQRVFSLGRKTTETFKSKKSGDGLKTVKSSESIKSVSDSVAGKGEHGSKKSSKYGSLFESRPPSVVADESKPARRSFSLLSRRSSRHRVSSASTLVEEEEEEDTPHSRQSPEIRAQAVGKEMTSESTQKPAPRLLPRPAQNDDRASFSVHEARKPKMETPGVYEDAREYILSPAGPTRGNSPSRFDEYSTAPSTPGLSSGSLDSSPRNSLMIAPPAYQETNSGTRASSVLQDHCDAECECQQPGMNNGPEIVVSKGVFATEQISVAQPALSLPLKEQTWNEEPKEPIDAADRFVAQTSRSVPDPVEPTPLPTPTPTPNAPKTDASPNSDITIAPSSVDQIQTGKLGAETTPDTDVPHHPDFPTREVRNAITTQELDDDSDLHVSDAETKVEESGDQDASENTGEDVGTATGAEVEPVEDNVRQGPPLSETELSPNVVEGVPTSDSSEEAGADEKKSDPVVNHAPEVVSGDSETVDAVDVGSAKEPEASSDDVDEPTGREADETCDAEVQENVDSVAESHPVIELDEVTALNASEPESLCLAAVYEEAKGADGSETKIDDTVDEAIAEEPATVPEEPVAEEKPTGESIVTEEATTVPEESVAEPEDHGTAPEEEATAPETIQDLDTKTEQVGNDVVVDQNIACEEQITVPVEDAAETQEEVQTPEAHLADSPDVTEAPEEKTSVSETEVTAAEHEATVPEEDAIMIDEATASELVADPVAPEEDAASEENITAPEEQAHAPETDVQGAEQAVTVPEKDETVAEEESVAPQILADSTGPSEDAASVEEVKASEEEAHVPETDVEAPVSEEDDTVAEKETVVDSITADADLAPEENPAAEEPALVPETDVKAANQTATVPEENEAVAQEETMAPEVAVDFTTVDEDLAPEQEITILEEVSVPETGDTAAEEEVPGQEEDVAATGEVSTAPELIAAPAAVGEDDAPEAVALQEATSSEADITAAEEDDTVSEEDVAETVDEGSVPEIVANSIAADEDATPETQLTTPEEEAVASSEDAQTLGTDSQATDEEVETTVEAPAALQIVTDFVAAEQEFASEEQDAAPEEPEVKVIELATVPGPESAAAEEESVPSDEQTVAPELLDGQTAAPEVVDEQTVASEDVDGQNVAPEAVNEQLAQEAPRDESSSLSAQLETEEGIFSPTEASIVDHVEATTNDDVVEDELLVKDKVPALAEAEVVENGEAVAPEATVEHDIPSEEPASVPEAAEEPAEELLQDDLDVTLAQKEDEPLKAVEVVVPETAVKQQTEAEAEAPVQTEAKIPKKIEIVVPKIVAEEQFAFELEVKAEDDAKVVSPPEFAPDAAVDTQKDVGVTASDVNEASSDIAEKELARELEVQANSSTEDELKEDAHQENEPPSDEGAAQLATEIIISQIVGAAISKNKTSAIKEDEVKAAAPSDGNESQQQAPEVLIAQILGAAISQETEPATEDDGRKAGMTEQQPVIEQAAVAPTISVKDFSQEPSEDEPTGEVTAVTQESQITTTKTSETTEHVEEETQKIETAPLPRVAIPDAAFLHPNRASTSTIGSAWSYSDTASLLSRGSVDTYRPSIDEQPEQAGEEEAEKHGHHHFRSCHQTAGLLGLERDSPRFLCEAGLRRALGDVPHLRRRKSMPFHSFNDSASVKSVGKRRRATSAFVKDEVHKVEENEEDGTVLPRMMALWKMITGA